MAIVIAIRILRFIWGIPGKWQDTIIWIQWISGPGNWFTAIMIFIVGIPVFILSLKILENNSIPKNQKTFMPFPNFDAWDAAQYILTQTEFGIGKSEGDISLALRDAAYDGKIRVWGLKVGGPDNSIIPSEIFRDHVFYLEPGASGGKVHDYRGWTIGECWIGPKLSREQIEAIWPRIKQ